MVCLIEALEYSHEAHGVVTLEVVGMADVRQTARSVQERLVFTQLWWDIATTTAFPELLNGVVDQCNAATQ